MHHLLAVTQKPFWPTRGKRQSGGLGLGFAGRWAARLLQNLQSTLNGVDDHFLHLQPWRGKNKSVSDCSALTVFHAAGKKMGKCPPVNSELRLRPAVWQLGKRQKVRARASFLDPRSTALYYMIISTRVYSTYVTLSMDKGNHCPIYTILHKAYDRSATYVTAVAPDHQNERYSVLTLPSVHGYS
jgi:hypothetical protein